MRSKYEDMLKCGHINRAVHLLNENSGGYGLNGGVKVSHLAEQKCTTYLLYSRDRPGCQIQS